jgi:hypothetical protein
VPVEIIGMVGTRDASEIKGPLVDGPVVDWMDGPVVDPDYLTAIAQAHDDGGFDRVLIGYGGVAPEGFAIAGSVLSCTRDLGVLIGRASLRRPYSPGRQRRWTSSAAAGGLPFTSSPAATRPTSAARATSSRRGTDTAERVS